MAGVKCCSCSIITLLVLFYGSLSDLFGSIQRVEIKCSSFATKPFLTKLLHCSSFWSSTQPSRRVGSSITLQSINPRKISHWRSRYIPRSFHDTQHLWQTPYTQCRPPLQTRWTSSLLRSQRRRFHHRLIKLQPHSRRGQFPLRPCRVGSGTSRNYQGQKYFQDLHGKIRGGGVVLLPLSGTVCPGRDIVHLRVLSEVYEKSTILCEALYTVSASYSARGWDLQRGEFERVWIRWEGSSSLLSEFVPFGKVVSRSQDVVLWRWPVLLLCHLRGGWIWGSYCWIFFQGKGVGGGV